MGINLKDYIKIVTYIICPLLIIILIVANIITTISNENIQYLLSCLFVSIFAYPFIKYVEFITNKKISKP